MIQATAAREPAETAAPGWGASGVTSLVERLAADLDGAFEEVVSGHQHALFSFIAGLCRDDGRAEEIVQDAFVRAHRALGGYPPERTRELALRPWLFRIALNALRSSLRGRRVELVLVERPPEGVDPGAGPEDEAMRREERERLLDALAGIPPAQRTAVLLHHAHDLGYAQIAEVVGQPVGTVKSNVHRGLEALRRALTGGGAHPQRGGEARASAPGVRRRGGCRAHRASDEHGRAGGRIPPDTQEES